MATGKTSAERSRISDSAVKKSTGKTWDEWHTELNKLGAKRMTHTEIAAHLRSHYELGGWWVQMVTVGYEQGRGLRRLYEKKSTSFDIIKTKTIAVPVAKAFSAWRDARLRKNWLITGELVVRDATRNKILRVTWSDKKTSLNINFYEKGADRCQVVVQHCRLPTAQAAEKKKEYWQEALQNLKEYLEK